MHNKETGKELQEFWDNEVKRMEKEITEIINIMYTLIETVENMK